MTMRHTNSNLVWEYLDYINFKDITVNPIKEIVSVATVDEGKFVINVGFVNGETYPVYVTTAHWQQFLLDTGVITSK